MYNIIFYRDKKGKSEIYEYLEELNKKASRNKNDRILRDKIYSQIKALSEYGTRLGEPILKHIDGDIWELRPINNRIFFFYWKDNNFVLLHHFIKKSQKTPVREIIQAKNKMKDFKERSE